MTCRWMQKKPAAGSTNAGSPNARSAFHAEGRWQHHAGLIVLLATLVLGCGNSQRATSRLAIPGAAGRWTCAPIVVSVGVRSHGTQDSCYADLVYSELTDHGYWVYDYTDEGTPGGELHLDVSGGDHHVTVETVRMRFASCPADGCPSVTVALVGSSRRHAVASALEQLLSDPVIVQASKRFQCLRREQYLAPSPTDPGTSCE